MTDRNVAEGIDGDKTLKDLEAQSEKVRRALDQLALVGQSQAQNTRRGAQKDKYAFWETQPVSQFGSANGPGSVGPIDPAKSVSEVKQEPYNLPPSFEWFTCDLNDKTIMAEVYNLLTFNYVEDDDNMFRFNYSENFLKWALHPPGYLNDWHIGIRVAASKKLVAFISAVPAQMRVGAQVMPMVDINFLCIHKRLRSKRLAPVLIKEVTRRVNLKNIWQAAYTAGTVLPTPISSAQYWHRPLNPRKLIAVQFSRLQERMTMARTVKLYKVDAEPNIPGLRVMVKSDVPQVTTILNAYLSRFAVAPIFSEEEVEHYFMPIEDVVDTHVVEGPEGHITDMLSYYTLPSTIIGNPQYDTLKAAFAYYTVSETLPRQKLMYNALVMANKTQHDVFNALDIQENNKVLKDLKFGIGDGRLRYYLYNWRLKQELPPSDIGLVLL